MGSDMLSLNWKFNYSAWKKCSREMFHCSINFLYFAFQLILYMWHEVTCAYLSQYWIFSHQMAIILKDLSICVFAHVHISTNVWVCAVVVCKQAQLQLHLCSISLECLCFHSTPFCCWLVMQDFLRILDYQYILEKED